MAIQRFVRVRYYLAFWLFVLSAVAFLDRTNVSIAGLQISKEYGLGNQQLGWIFSAFLIGYAAFQLPAGWLSAKYGPRKVIGIGVLWWGVATALTALLPSTLAHSLLFLIAIRVSLGIGEAVIYPAANQFVAQWIPIRERGFVNGLIFAGVGAGSGLTPLLLTWLIVHHGWRSAFWFSAAIGVIASAVWWFSARDTPDEHPQVSLLEKEEINEGTQSHPFQTAPDVPPEATQQNEVAWKAVFSRRDLPLLMIAYFSFVYIAWIFFSWFFLYMAQVRGFDLKRSAAFTMLPFICMTIFCLLGGWLSDRLTRTYGLRVGRCILAVAASLLTAAFLVLGSQVFSPALAGVFLAGGGGVLYASQSSYWSVSNDIAGRSSGVFASTINMAGQIGGAVATSLTPWIAQRFGWTTSFGFAAVLAVIAAVCWLGVHPERPMQA